MESANERLSARLRDLETHWERLDPAASEERFRSLLPEALLLTGRDRSYLIFLLIWIARAESLQGKSKEAHESLEKALSLLEEEEATYPVAARIRWLIERGRLHIQEKTPSQAKALFSEAWTLAVNSGEDYFAVEIAQLMAESEPQKSQQAWIERAIKIAEGSPLKESKKWLGSLYTALGWKLYELKQLENSLETFQKALSHIKATGTDREAFFARWSIGKVLRTLGRTEDALAVQKALLSELGIGGRRDGRLYEELAECLQTLKRTTEAQLYFELAYRELSSDEWVTDNQPVQLKRLKDLGKVK